MRLRAQLANITAFSKLVESISKLSKRAVFKFTPTELKIIATGDFEDGVRFYGTVKIVELFGTQYRIESNAENSIALELSTHALASGLRQSSSVPTEVVIRLGKVGKTPFLSLSAKTVGRSGQEYDVEQCVAVRVLKPVDSDALGEPDCPIPDVKISLPKLSDVCKVAERLKSLSDSIQVSASRAGGFRLGISTEHASVETEWRGLSLVPGPPAEDGEGAPSTIVQSQRGTAAFFQTTVKSRGLLRFLHAHTIGEAAIACICEGHSLILFIYIGELAKANSSGPSEGLTGSLIAYMPAINEDGDD